MYVSSYVSMILCGSNIPEDASLIKP